MKRILKSSVVIILIISMLMMSIACTVEANKIKVTLDLQNGSEPIVLYVNEGNTVEFPEMEDAEYKTFRGWFKDAKCTSLWDATTTITSETTIYAGWKNKTSTLLFDFNYEGSPEPTTISVNMGTKIKEPALVTNRECWTLLGWFTDKEATVPFNWDEIITDKSLTLYAGWKLEDGHSHEYVTTTVSSCLNDGYDMHACRCGDYYTDNEIAMTGHIFDYENADYIEMIHCLNKGCNAITRKDSERIYDDDFVYNFDDAKKAEIDGRYEEILETLGAAAAYDAALHGYVKDSERYLANKAFEDVYNAFYDDIIYVIEQYQYAYVFYCVDGNKENTDKYEFISEYRTSKISDFYALYRLIYETEYREYFFAEEEGWTSEDINEALILADSYGSEKYKDFNDRINEIEIEFRDLDDPASDDAVPELYEEFVELNNKIAQLSGYDNYIDYAYENVYSRDYTPEETAQMRNFVKSYFKGIFQSLYLKYASLSLNAPSSGTEAYDVYNALLNKSIFETPLTSKIVKDYLQVMQSSDAGDQEIDFYYHANELFKNGNYYTGSYSGAFSYWISAQNTSILYFGPGSYSGAFTFIHEYGHYYQNVYNKGINVSYDLEEIYSQGNEMMLLAYLEDTLDDDILAEIYDDIYYDNLFNSLAIILLATAVDEFEYCVYTGTSPDGTPTQYTAEDYDELFLTIMKSYGIGSLLNPSYWRYVVIEAPCYYISYAMSAIPCLELLSIADTEGFDVAQEIYLNLFTFTDDEANVEIDEMGDKTVKIGFADTLEYVGLNSVFDVEVYTRISEYFATEKDFTYGDEADAA